MSVLNKRPYTVANIFQGDNKNKGHSRFIEGFRRYVLAFHPNMDKRKLKLCGKLIACCVAFIVVLSTGLASKAAIFFMTSSMGQELKELYPGGRHRYAREKGMLRKGTFT